MGIMKDFFAAIVREVAENWSDFEITSTDDFEIDATVRSNSGKSRWNAHLEYDDETGNFSIHAPYYGKPGALAREVQRKIKEETDDTWPRIGDLVRVGSGRTPWRVVSKADVGPFIRVASTKSGVQRSEVTSALTPYDA